MRESAPSVQSSATVGRSSEVIAEKQDLTALHNSIVSELNSILEKYHKGDLPEPFLNGKRFSFSFT